MGFLTSLFGGDGLSIWSVGLSLIIVLLLIVAAVFLFDLLVAKHGWCGHVCPVGASYALIGSKPLLRVAATHSARCDDCGDCYAVCPEPQVIVMPLKGKAGHGPVVGDRECTACGRCIDVCAPDVFRFTHRFDTRRDPT